MNYWRYLKMRINFIKKAGKAGKAVLGAVGAVGIAGLAKIAKDSGPKVIKAAVKIIKK